MKNILRNYLQKKTKIILKEKLKRDENSNNALDFLDIKNSKFKIAPSHRLDREDRMKKLKSSLNLSFLQNTDNTFIHENKRVGEVKQGLIFKKFNPI